MQKCSWVTCVLLLSACATGSTGDDRSSSPIIAGEPYDGDPSTILVSRDGEFDCTGSVIDVRVVLTARHCVENPQTGERAAPSSLEILQGSAFEGATRIAGVADFDTTTGPLDGQDIAVLILDTALSLTPYPWQREGTIADGLSIVGVGYGLTSTPENGPTPPRKHRGTAIVESSMQTEFITTTPFTCYGDSGGPAFDPAGVIVGVTSRGLDLTCTDRSIFTRTDAFRSLIEGAIARAGAASGAPPGATPPPSTTPPPGATLPPPGPATPPGTPAAPSDPPADAGGPRGCPYPGCPGSAGPGGGPGSQGAPGDTDADGCPDEIDEAPTQFDPYPFAIDGYPCFSEEPPYW